MRFRLSHPNESHLSAVYGFDLKLRPDPSPFATDVDVSCLAEHGPWPDDGVSPTARPAVFARTWIRRTHVRSPTDLPARRSERVTTARSADFAYAHFFGCEVGN